MEKLIELLISYIEDARDIASHGQFKRMAKAEEEMLALAKELDKLLKK